MKKLLSVVAFYVFFLAAYFPFKTWSRAIYLDTPKETYSHYEMIPLQLRTRNPALKRQWRTEGPPNLVVLKQSQVVTTIAGIREVRLKWDADSQSWRGLWPCPWNAEEGPYQIAFAEPTGPQVHVRSRPFRIAYRNPKPLPSGFVALTFESVRSLRGLKVVSPDGSVKDWRGLLDWVEYVGADAFWMLAGQTPGERPGEVWVSSNLPMLPQVAQECQRRGIQFGVWAMCYLTMSKDRLQRYQYALDYVEDQIRMTRAISLRDENRSEDLIRFLKELSHIPGVDYVGLDYIRNPLGGYELMEDFFREMPGVMPPPEWNMWSPKERMAYFTKKKITRRDANFIDAWQWWRARRVALIVEKIARALGGTKPLWAFTLSWQMGWHHGQDPVMMNDAGVDVDAIMLYEANQSQFDQLMRDWNSYMRAGQAQLIVGDVIDWPLHQRSADGPGEFYRRMRRGISEIYGDSIAKGIFIHDLDRALWGRLGPYSTKDWMNEAKKVARHFKGLRKSQSGQNGPGSVSNSSSVSR